MQGYFVKVPAQAVVLSKHDRQPTAKVGLELVESFITEGADSSLLDPALESSNYQAPGASRYKLTLDLAVRDINSIDDEKYIQIARIENGVIKEKVTSPTYSEIEEVLARRTYDESGNYIVNPFKIILEDSATDPANNVLTKISAGKAYLYGYETEIQTDLSFDVPKSRNFLSKTDFDLNMNYGNYMIVDNLKGAFNTRMGVVDIHCVTSNQVNTSSLAAYNSTKIGTARLRDLQFFSGGANTAQRAYEFYFVDNKFKTLTENSNNSTITLSNNQIYLGNTANISLINDAYANATVKILSGKAQGDVRQIISYNGSSRIANVSLPFTQITDNTTRYQITFDITDADSFYQSSLYTSGATSNASATVALISKSDGTYNGDTIVSEPGYLNALFSYPKSYIKSTSNHSYVYRRVYNTVQFTSGESQVITASTDEQFVGASSTSNTSSTVMDNWLVIVTNPLTSSRNVGDQVLITTSITNSTPEQATLSTGNVSESFIATVYTKVNAKTNAATPRVKTLVLANTQTFTSETASGPFQNSTGSKTWVYPNSGQVVIQNPSKTEFESLFISDVITCAKIYSTSTMPTAGDTISTLLDVTDRYVFDSGQTATHYDHARIRLKPGYATPTNYIIVCFRAFKSGNDTGFFSINSYPSLETEVVEEGVNIGTGYALIPKIAGFRLSDVIDFRPVRPNASNTEFYSFTSAITPVATTDFTSDYNYYIGRRDLFVLTIDKKILRIPGLPAEVPSFPVAPERSMILHRLQIAPYTETLRDILITTPNHRRYTMKDISNIDKRLSNVEYAVSLNTLEKKAEDILIQDADGLDRTKYGILAESFKSHLLGDTNSPDYACLIDTGKVFTNREGMMTAKMVPHDINLKLDKNSARNVSMHDDKILLAYTTVPAISQVTATKTAPVAEFLFADFRGNMVCVPEADIWKDTTLLAPTVITIPKTIVEVPVKTTVDKKPIVIINDGNYSGGGGGDDGGTVITPTTGTYDYIMYMPASYLEGKNSYSLDPNTGRITGSYTGTDSYLTVGLSKEAAKEILQAEVNKSGMFSSPVTLTDKQVEFTLTAYANGLDRNAELAGAVFWAGQAIKENWTSQSIANQNILLGSLDSTEYLPGNFGKYRGDNVIDAVVTKDSLSAGTIVGASETSISTGSVITGDNRELNNATFVLELYQTFLDRDPRGVDPGYQAWLNALETNAMTQAEVLQGFANSAEYAERGVIADLNYAK